VPGDHVLLGQKIGEAAGPVSAPIHATVSGTVIAVEPRPHPNGNLVPAVVIENDFQDSPVDEIGPRKHADQLTPPELQEIIRESGIVGMGGAAFPSHVKVSSGLGKVDTLIINGSECEPYITSDYRMMLERPYEILDGIDILLRLFGLERAYLAIESNKHPAVEGLMDILAEGGKSKVIIRELRTRYPQGAEKQLIQTITGRQVPPGKLPADVGCAVFNVDTTAAIFRAVNQGMPLIRRIVTVSGSAVRRPKNLRVRIGTPIRDLFESAGGFSVPPKKIIMGGPMMGVAQYDLSVPVIKGTNALLAMTDKECRIEDTKSCIRCGKCVSVCPMHLMPLYLNIYADHNRFDQLEAYNLMDCIECGACTFICPARQPLVHNFRTAKRRLGEEKKRQQRSGA
jgi:electron transport complex protein RnfC